MFFGLFANKVCNSPRRRALRHSGFVHRNVSEWVEAGLEQRFDREYAENIDRGRGGAITNPGASVRWRTTSTASASIRLNYVFACARDMVYDGACPCECRVRLYVDGVERRDQFDFNQTSFAAGMLAIDVALPRPSSDVALVWPWCAAGPRVCRRRSARRRQPRRRSCRLRRSPPRGRCAGSPSATRSLRAGAAASPTRRRFRGATALRASTSGCKARGCTMAPWRHARIGDGFIRRRLCDDCGWR